MTDNEISKALRCCAQPDPICKECPCYDPYLKYPCADQLKWAALNLIDSQKAEIERLEAQNGVYETCNARKQEAIDTLENSLAISKKETKRYVENYKRQKKEMEEYRNIIERATEGIREVKAMLPRELAKERAKAVKEYAKILKTKVDIDLCSAIDCSDYLTDDLPKIIDNLVKKFTEGGNTAQEVLKKITSKEFKSRPHIFEDMLFDNAKDAMEGG